METKEPESEKLVWASIRIMAHICKPFDEKHCYILRDVLLPYDGRFIHSATITEYITQPKAFSRWNEEDVANFKYVAKHMAKIYPEAAIALYKYNVYINRPRRCCCFEFFC
jgi:hypothetical protein